MKIRKKNALIAATAAFAVAFAAGGAAMKVNVNADEAESEILTIRQGASVRISENYAQNGIRYELNMQKSDYEDLKESNPNVVFGMFIAPVDYETLYAPLTEENLTGENAKYGWAEKLEDGTYGKYTGTKTQIINLVTDEMGEKDGAMVWYASLVNLLHGENGGTDNRNREFIGIGYMKAGDVYTFAARNDNVRSMTYVAQQAREKDTKLTETQKTALYENYIKDFVNTDVSYTVNYVYDNGLAKTAKTITQTAKLDSEIVITPEESVAQDGFVYSTAETQLKSTAYANGKTQFTVNYKQSPEYEIDFKNAAVEGNKITGEDFIAESTGTNVSTLASSENGLKVSGSTAWQGVNFRFSASRLKPETKYNVRLALKGNGGKAYLGVNYYNAEGKSYDTLYDNAGNATPLYRTEFSNGGNFWAPSADGTEIIAQFVTPHVRFSELVVYVATTESAAYAYEIPSVEIFERGENSDYGLMITANENGKNVPFGWLGAAKGVVGATYDLSADQGNLAGKVTWSSSDESVATVDNGRITFKKAGKTEIKAALGDHADYANFTVYDAGGNYSVTSGNAKLVYDAENPADFVLDVAEGKNFKVLQISDPQVADMSQIRSGREVNGGLQLLWADRDFSVYAKLKKTIEETQPDLILLAGDIIYGEFDDNGEMAKELISFFEARKIFYAPVFGNHDNESAQGTSWQVRQYLNSEYCLFARGTVTGNCNYTISVKQGEKWLSNIYMLDTNGCIYNTAKVSDNLPQGLYDSTVNDMIAKDEAISAYQSNAATSDMACMHIPVANFYNVLTKYGFGEGNLDVNLADNATAKANGDFGHVKAEKNFLNLVSDKYRTYDIGKIFGRIGVKNVLAGHCHFTNTSAVADNGVRYTFGLKAGLIPEATAGETGGTTFTFGENGFTAAPYYDNYANNTLTGVAETTNIIAYGETENGYRVAYGKNDNWAFIRFKTAYTLKAGANYTLSVKLRVNTLNNTALTNLNIDDNYNNEKFLNNWTEIGETNGKKEYTIKRNFQATADGDFLLRLACSHAAEYYSYNVELFDVTLEEKDYSNNTLTGLNGDTAFTNEQTENGWNIYFNKSADWNTIVFNTKYSVVAQKEYRLTVKLRIDQLSGTNTKGEIIGISNFYIDNQDGGDIPLTDNKWKELTPENGNDGSKYYIQEIIFTASSDKDFVLRLACNFNGNYIVAAEIYDVTIEEFGVFTSQNGFASWERTQTGATVKLNFTGWTTPKITTKSKVESGKKYTVTFNISDFSNTLQDSISGCLVQNYNGTSNEWKAFSVGENTFTVSAASDGVLILTFAFNDSAKKGSTITFTISDFTVTEAAEA